MGQQEEVLKKRKSRKYQQELEQWGKTELMELKGKGCGIARGRFRAGDGSKQDK